MSITVKWHAPALDWHRMTMAQLRENIAALAAEKVVGDAMAPADAVQAVLTTLPTEVAKRYATIPHTTRATTVVATAEREASMQSAEEIDRYASSLVKTGKADTLNEAYAQIFKGDGHLAKVYRASQLGLPLPERQSPTATSTEVHKSGRELLAHVADLVRDEVRKGAGATSEVQAYERVFRQHPTLFDQYREATSQR